MIKKKQIISALMSFSLLIGSIPVLASDDTDDAAALQEAEKKILFSDDFSDNSKWSSKASGKMEISSGSLNFKKSLDDGVKSTVTAVDYSFENGHISFDVKLNDCKGFSVMFRVSDDNNNYRLCLEADKVTLEKKVNGGNYIKIESAGVKLVNNKEYAVDIGLLGARITVDIDGVNYIDSTDYSFSDGYMGFSASLGSARVDNLEIYEISTDLYIEKSKSENSVEIFVSPDGDDKNGNGSYEKPYATMEKAKSAVRRLKALNRPINVVFKEGVYYFDKAVTFESADSGDSFVPITYKGEDGAKVEFAGTKRLDISQFTPVTDKKIRERLYEDVRDKVLELDLSKQGIKREDIDVITGYKNNTSSTLLLSSKFLLNNRVQPLAKWPNSGWTTIESCSNANFNGEYGKIFFNNAEPLRWLEAKDAFAEGNMFYEWFSEAIPIKGINTETMAMEFSRKGSYGVREGHEYRVINLLEEIDIPGEWYVDYDSMILYYYPQHELSEDDVLEVTTLEDSFIYLNDVSGVSFENIIFENSRGLSKPYNWQQASRISGGGIEIGRYAKNIIIDGCTFKDIGGSGIRRIVSVGSSNLNDADCNLNIHIQNCNFYRCSYGALSIRAGDSPRLKQAKIYVKNNFFYDCSPSFSTQSNCGIEITNNLSVKTRLQALGCTGNEFKIDNNEIVYGSYEASDMGAIYVGRNVAGHGSSISRNLIIDFGPTGKRDFPAGAIYLDDAEGGITLEKNISTARSKDYYSTGVIYGGGPDIVYKGNISINANRGFTIQNRIGSYITTLGGASSGALAPYSSIMNTNFDGWAKKYPTTARFKELFEDPKKYTSDICIKENLSTNSITPFIVTSADLKPNLTGEIEEAIVIDDTDIYVDPEHYDYRITKEAKEKYNLPDSLPCEDNLDIDSIGLQRELKYDDDLINFNITCPQNGETVKYSNAVSVAWEESDAANVYEYTVAKDKDFKEIAASGESTDSFVSLTNLEQNTKYYIKVTAKNTSRKCNYEIENQNGAIEFTTPSIVHKNTALLDKTIDSLSDKISKLKVGNKKGDCSSEIITKLKKVINETKAVAQKPETTQEKIDELSNELIGYYNSIDAYRNVGYTALELTEKSQWITTTPVKSMYLTDGRADFVTDSGGNMTLKGEIPNTDIICFRVKLTNIRGWNGFALKIKNPENEMYSDNCYYVAIKDDVFELQRKGKILQTFANDGIFKENTWYDIQLGCVTLEGGVNIIFRVDGKDVFDYYDDSGEAEYEAGSFAMNIRGNVGVSVAEPTYVPEEFYEPSQEIQDIVKFGKYSSFAFASDTFNKISGEWQLNGEYTNNTNSPSGEIVSQDAGAAARWSLVADGDTTYRVYYWNHPSEENDSEVKVTVSGKDGTYKTTIDMTKGEEGYIELGTFKFVSDDAKVGMINVVFEGSGKGKLPLSAVRIRKTDKDKYPDMLTLEQK